MAVTQEAFPVIKMTAEADELSDIVSVNFLHWYSPDADAGDLLLVVDTDDNEVWADVADGLYTSKRHVLKHPINKLKISKMDSGTLYVIKEPPLGFNA
ncbi:MAG: hypothetical protein MUF84_11640 [Anaerolineae bacterium]|jgi:hypothetical protein|nr:hypothetical protein [Anaerolineae bacterium]